MAPDPDTHVKSWLRNTLIVKFPDNILLLHLKETITERLDPDLDKQEPRLEPGRMRGGISGPGAAWRRMRERVVLDN